MSAFVWRAALWVCAIVGVGILLFGVVKIVARERALSCLSSPIRSHVRAVANAYWMSCLNLKDAWDKNLRTEASEINGLSPDERMEFYRGVMSTCSLDASYMEVFCGITSNDRTLLLQKSRNFQNDDCFDRLTKKQKVRFKRAAQVLENYCVSPAQSR
jgi:hypothetical protein